MDEVREFTAPSRLLNQPLLSFLLLTALYVSYGLLAGLSTQIISPAASSAWLCSVGTDGGWDGWVLCLEEHRQGHRPIYNILKRQTQSHCSAVGTFSPRTNLKKKRVFAITTTKNQLESLFWASEAVDCSFSFTIIPQMPLKCQAWCLALGPREVQLYRDRRLHRSCCCW